LYVKEALIADHQKYLKRGSMRTNQRTTMALLSLVLASSWLLAATREVGPGRTYATPNDAYTAAAAGDTILVYPQAANAAYLQVRIQASKARIAIRAMGAAGQRVKLSGAGYNYTGAASVPRAMFQFNPGTDSCLVEGFEIFECHNDSYNGAAVRINQANRVTVRNCEVHNNDMGFMSNGDVNASSAADQLIENCVVHDNGNDSAAGYNHNFYMGGTSVTIRGCNVYNATTGHNIKSRAHLTFVEGCFVHDSPNREFDLVDDATNTTAANSHALVSGCVIRKMNNCPGNHATIHFGQDGGNDHNGTLYLVHCTILSQYASPIVDVSAAGAGVKIYNCIVTDPTASQTSGQVVVSMRNGALAANSGGSNVWMSRGFTAGTGITFAASTTGSAGQYPAFVNDTAGTYTPTTAFANIVDAGMALATMGLPSPLSTEPLLVYAVGPGTATRTFNAAPDIGAFEYGAQAVVTAPNTAWVRVASGPALGRGFDLAGRTTPAKAAGAGLRVDPRSAELRVRW
jgi:hypothetical protein